MGRHHRGPALAFVTIAAVYAAVCVTWAAGRTLEVAVDSPRYLPPTPILAPDQPGVLTGLAFHVLGGPSPRLVFAQVSIAVASWLLLALAVYRSVTRWMGWLLACGVLLYSLTFQVLSWQLWALSDGLSLSLFTLWMASTVLGWCDRPGAAAAWWTTATTVLASLARPQLTLVLLPVQAMVLGHGWQGTRRAQRGGAALVLAVAFGWGGYRLWQATATPDGRARYAINNLVGKEDYRRHAAPALASCPEVLQAAVSFEAMSAVRDRLSRDCPVAFSWLASPRSSWLQWALPEPVPVVRGFLRAIRYAILPQYSAQRGLLPDFLERLLLIQRGSIARAGAWYLALGTVLMLAVRGQGRPTLAGLAIAGLAGCGAITYCFVTWAADGMEIPRHMMPVLAVLPPVVFVAPALLCGRADSTGLPPKPRRRTIRRLDGDRAPRENGGVRQGWTPPR